MLGDAVESIVCPHCSAILSRPSCETVALQATPEAQSPDTVDHVSDSIERDPDATRTRHPGNDVGNPAELPTIPGYRILGELGRGGMGVVYKAQQLALKRTVALKMILGSGHAGWQERERFRMEAEAVARLQHPNIVQIHEVGEFHDHPYCALEFVDGGTLAQKIAGKPLAPAEAAEIVESLARAMHVAHSRNIVHRDLKPANVLLTSDGTPKVTDFGLAKRLDSDSVCTLAGAIMGTPSYMAPEQAQGETNSVGPAADIYALGGILFECLSGQPPFKGKSVLETLEQVRTKQPELPSRLQRRIPHDLKTICLKCLRKEPENRYASAEALAEDLRRWRTGEPIAARPVGRTERTFKWMRRNPVVTALLMLVVLALAGGTVGTYLKYIDARDQKAIVAQKAVDLEDANGKLDEALKQQSQLVDDLQREKSEVEKQRSAVQKQLDRAEFVGYAYRLNDGYGEIERGKFDHAMDVLTTCKAELCGWEHEYMLQLCQRPFISPALDRAVHKKVIRDVGLSGDGKRVASASDDGTLKVLDVESGRELFTLTGHEGPVSCVQFSPDGKRIISGNYQTTPGGVIRDGRGIVKVWNAETGKEIFEFTLRKMGVSCLCFSPDGKRIASGDLSGLIYIWDSETGKEFNKVKLHDSNVDRICFSPSGMMIASVGDGNRLKIWNEFIPKAEPLELKGHTTPIRCLNFSSDGSRLVTGAERGTESEVRLWNLRDLSKHVAFKQNGTGTVGVGFVSGNNRIISVSVDGQVILWDPAKGELVDYLGSMKHGFVRACLSADQTKIAGCAFTGRISVIDLHLNPNPHTIKLSQAFITDASMSRDGTRVVTADRDGLVKVVDTATGLTTVTIQVPGGFSRYVSFSPDGTRIATGGTIAQKAGQLDGLDEVRIHDASTGNVLFHYPGNGGKPLFTPDGRYITITDKIVEAETGKEVVSMKSGKGTVNILGFHADSKRVLGSVGNDVVVCDRESGKELLALSGHKAQVRCAAFSPDGKRIVSGSVDAKVRVWDAETGELIHILSGHTGYWIEAVQFSPDGKRILSAAGDTNIGEMKLWDAETGQEALNFKDMPWWVRAAGFSTDGRRIYAAGQDGTLRIYNTTSASWVHSLRGHKAPVAIARISPDGKRIASASNDGAVKLWDVVTGKELHSLETHSSYIRSLAFSSDGLWLASGSYDQEVKIWDVATGKEKLSIDPKFIGNRVNAVAFTADGQGLIVGTDQPDAKDNLPLQICNAVTGEKRESYKVTTQNVHSIHVNSDGSRMLVTGIGAQLLNAKTGQPIKSIGIGDRVRMGRLSPDGKRAIFVLQGGQITIRNVETGKQDHILNGQYLCADYSPDGKWIVTSGKDRKVTVRSVTNVEQTYTIGQHLAEVNSVMFSPDSKCIVSCSNDRTVKLWTLPANIEQRLGLTTPETAPMRKADPR